MTDTRTGPNYKRREISRMKAEDEIEKSCELMHSDAKYCRKLKLR